MNRRILDDAGVRHGLRLRCVDPAAAIRRMRKRVEKPDKTPDIVRLDMEADGLIETVDILRPPIESL